MDTLTYSSARESLASVIDRVCVNHEPIVVTKKHEQSVVMISLEDYEALEATAYLLRSPKNARRILASLDDLDAKRGLARKLHE